MCDEAGPTLTRTVSGGPKSPPPAEQQISNIANNIRRLAGTLHKKADEVDELRDLSLRTQYPKEQEALLNAAIAMRDNLLSSLRHW